MNKNLREISKVARQKTLSVKWHQSKSETRLCDRRNAYNSNRLKENSYRNRQAMPRMNLNEFMSRQESLAPATVTTPLMVNNTNLNATCNNEICDCELPHDCNIASNIGHRQQLTHVANLVNNCDRFKSESC